MTDVTVYLQRARFTRDIITEEMTQLPENATWMIPASDFVGLYFVSQVGSAMPIGVVSAEQFDAIYQSEDEIASGVQASKAAKPA